MNPIIGQVIESKEYEELPLSIKSAYTLKEFLWLSDFEKATLVQRETEPEEPEP